MGYLDSTAFAGNLFFNNNLISAPLYLFEKFFSGIATEHLLGEAIQPEHLNDDPLGRVVDKLYDAGLMEILVIESPLNKLLLSNITRVIN